MFHDTETTYAGLDERANRIAHYLLERIGATPGSLVGILMDRSEAMLAGMMGVLKAGCAYVPLDPDYPRDRLAYMVEDSGLQAIVSETRTPTTCLTQARSWWHWTHWTRSSLASRRGSRRSERARRIWPT